MIWNINIQQTVAKRNKKLGFLKRNLKINNLDIKTHDDNDNDKFFIKPGCKRLKYRL